MKNINTKKINAIFRRKKPKEPEISLHDLHLPYELVIPKEYTDYLIKHSCAKPNSFYVEEKRTACYTRVSIDRWVNDLKKAHNAYIKYLVRQMEYWKREANERKFVERNKK